MMQSKDEFIRLMEQHPQYKADLFIRGFFITDKLPQNMNEFPFYGEWKCEYHAKYYFVSHKLTGVHICEVGNRVFFLLGHAYDPFTMEIDENKILHTIAANYGTEQYLERISDITGVFALGSIDGEKIEYITDPSGMQSLCSGVIDGTFYLTSHPQIVGDICSLDMDGFVRKLIAYKWYGRVMGPYLPADLTPFAELKRAVPNIIYRYDGKTITHRRYWPLKNQTVVADEQEYRDVIEAAAEILRRNMELVSKKWNHPWISLTGGIDSNTTFAAGNGHYDKFETFSYISAEKELPDAEAAKKISAKFGTPHHEYHIPDDSTEIRDFEIRRELFRHNNGYVAELYDNEARKKFYLRDVSECDVEVKSWVSETSRGYWYKHYGRTSMPKLSARLFRNLYKIFILDRSLAHDIDKIFASYIQDFEYDKIPAIYPAADMHFNEVTWGSWGGMNMTEMKYCFDITIIYNNRRFLDLMFRVPLEKRISDQHHLDMKKYLNKDLYDMGIRVVNLKETDTRARLLNALFKINTYLPF